MSVVGLDGLTPRHERHGRHDALRSRFSAPAPELERTAHFLKENVMTEYDDEGRRVVEPEILVNGTYRKAYSDEAFHSKLLRFAGTIGKEGLRSALILYYTLQRKDLPGKTRAIILGALGYFILPVDVIPDIVPVLGFTDDIGILAAALAAVAMYVDDEVRAKADAALDRWLGRAEKVLGKK